MQSHSSDVAARATSADDLLSLFSEMFVDDDTLLGSEGVLSIRMALQWKKAKTKLDSFLDNLTSIGWKPGLTQESYLRIICAGFNGKNLILAAIAAEIALQENPITLRGLFYRVVSAGVLPSTDAKHYKRIGRVMTKLRESGVVPFSWLIDSLRSTVKPSSWSGVNDYVETVRDCYRKDFWASLPEYVHIFCEKDAIAGTLAPVTREFDVALSPIRGYSSLSFAHQIADEWNQIEKPITAYYVGDYDPSGFDLERDIREKLRRYCDVVFEWVRLGVLREDFDEFDLIRLDPKKSDKRYQAFVEQYGESCAEIDAIPATELRRRIQDAIESHVPSDEWERLQAVEKAEKETFGSFLDQLPGGSNA